MTQAQALNILKTGTNVFLTGSAGSGKTYVLNQYVEYLKAHGVGVAVTASTGIAATHMNGMTIHSWSGLGIRDSLSEQDIDELEQKAYLWKRFEKTSVLIIDEVSMLHGYRLDMIDQLCRSFKRDPRPFGGIQVVLCGDFFQLPPVTRDSGDSQDNDRSKGAFASRAWREAGFTTCYLTEQHRQDDELFLGVLNGIRAGSGGEEVLAPLRTRYRKTIDSAIRPTKLYTHNVDVDTLNQQELNNLGGTAKVFHMETYGKDNLVETLKKSVLAHEVLHLKVGAQVMFVKNNFEAGYANGTLGVIKEFLPDGMPVVQTLKGDSIFVSSADWSIEENGKIKASVSQIPLRHAWAITIHKSQGMSLDAAEIDLSKSFTYGMGYVALSRVRTLAGLSLMGMHKDALLVDPDILSLDEDLRVRSDNAIDELEDISADKLQKTQDEFVLHSGGTLVPEEIEKNREAEKHKKGIKNAEPKQRTHLTTKDMLDSGLTLEQIATERGVTLGTIISHLLTLKEEALSFETKHIKQNKKLIAEVKKAIDKLEDNKLTPIKNYLDEAGFDATFDDIKLALVFV